MRFISDGKRWPDEKVVEFVERQKWQHLELGYCFRKLVLKHDHHLVGVCGLQPLDDLPGVKIGWWLSQDSGGKA